MKKILLVVSLLVLLVGKWASAEDAGSVVEDGILDWIQLHARNTMVDAPVVVHLFDASDADLGTGSEGGKPKHVEAAKTMQQEAPPLFADELVKHIKEIGPFSEVHLASEGDEFPQHALVIDGRFTILDPGSRAKRYWGGFGAGKGSWEIRGTIKDSTGKMLAEFRHKRITVMGAFGGNPVKKMRRDCERLGKDIAVFLNAWATGKSLEED